MAIDDKHPKCVHCGGKILSDGGERRCLQCGREWKTIHERHSFYDEHKSEILQDISAIGKGKAQAKWQIPSGSINKILRHWLDMNGSPAPAKAAPSPNGKLPELPAFSKDWPEEVQLRWLDTYREIVIANK